MQVSHRVLRTCGALALAGVVAVGVAQAAPSTKNYDAAVTPSGGPLQLTITLKNDTSSQQTLGSANFVAPAGLSLTPGTATPLKAGWTACIGDGMTCGATPNTTVMLRSSKGAELSSDTFMQASVAVTRNAACSSANPSSATWRVFVKQSNDFSGNGNDFAPKTIDLNPLGRFDVQTIGDPRFGSYYVSRETEPSFAFVATAYDTCGNVKKNYNGASTFTPPDTYGVSLTKVGDSLDGTSLPSLAWTGGVGTATPITPVVAQVGNSLRIADATGITRDSNTFDVVDHLCDSGTTCRWQDTTQDTTVVADIPAAGGTIGVGFKKSSAVPTFLCGTRTTAIGSIVEIVPSAQFPTGPYTVSMIFSKKVSGSGPASGFVVCLSKDNGATWGDFNPPGDNIPLAACSTTVPAPCVSSKKRISGGALEVDLSLNPIDPWPGVG